MIKSLTISGFSSLTKETVRQEFEILFGEKITQELIEFAHFLDKLQNEGIIDRHSNLLKDLTFRGGKNYIDIPNFRFTIFSQLIGEDNILDSLRLSGSFGKNSLGWELGVPGLDDEVGYSEEATLTKFIIYEINTYMQHQRDKNKEAEKQFIKFNTLFS